MAWLPLKNNQDALGDEPVELNYIVLPCRPPENDNTRDSQDAGNFGKDAVE